MNRHFILTNGRSGSNYFVQALNQHPEIVNYGEVLGDWTMPGRYLRPRFQGEGANARFLDCLYENPLAFMAGQAVSYAARLKSGRRRHFRLRNSVESIGVKEFTVNLSRYDLQDYLAERQEIRLITLVRENPLSRLLSSRTLKATGEVARTSQSGADQGGGIRLDPGAILGDLEIIEAENAAVRAAARAHKGDVFSLVYEEYFAADAAGQAETLKALQRFLGVEPRALETEHRRLRQRPIEQAVSNFPEIRERLAGSRFERWLEQAF